MRYLVCSKSIIETTSRCQKLQIQVKPPPKIHIVDFKRIEEEKRKKNEISQLLVFKNQEELYKRE
jgi:hypothetical protein